MKSLNNIIERLKQQPRIGYPDPNPNPSVNVNLSTTEAQVNAIKADINALKNSLSKFAEDFAKTYESTMQAVSDSNLTLQYGLSGLINVFDTYKNSMIAAMKQATFLEQRNKSLNTGLGITTKQSIALGESYDSMAESLRTSGEQIRNYAVAINKNLLPGMTNAIGANSTFSTGLMMTQDILTKQVGLSAESAANFELYAAGIGKSGIAQLGALDAFTDKFEKSSGMIGVFKDISAEIAGLGSDIQMAYGKLPGSLELSVMKSRMLGMKFSEIETMATNMLNIEDSVNKELEYQLLSGKRLADADGKSLTEKLRMAKITGDANKMVEATAEIYETQGDILEGNNHYAKEGLAQLMGMTQAQMMKAYQTQKLIKKGFPEGKVEEILAMDPAQYAEAMKNVSTEQQKIFDKLKADRSQLTTDEKMSELLDMKRTIKVVNVAKEAGGQEKLITGAQNRILGADGKGGAVTGAIEGMLNTLVSKPASALLGTTQLLGTTAAALNTAVSTLTTKIPVLGNALDTLTNKLKQFTEAAYGTSGGALPGATPDPTTKTPDGILVNDAVVQFHPADKFATVSDGAALLASTERGKLDTAVDTLTGGGGKTAVVDPNPIARAVAAEIQKAMAGMRITLGGEQLVKGIEFDNRTIN